MSLLQDALSGGALSSAFGWDWFGGGGGGGAPSYGKMGKKQLNLNLLYPLLFQAFSANAAMGKDPLEFLQQFKVDKKGFKAAKGTDAAEGYLHIGNSFFDVGGLTKALPGLLQQQQDFKSQQFQQTYDTLSKVPGLSPIFEAAKGNFDPAFTASIGSAFDSLAQNGLGQAAKSGFLADPNKQASVLGPLALQKAQYIDSIKQAAQAQANGLAGVGGLAGAAPANLGGAAPTGSYIPNIFNVAQMQQQQDQFNQQLGFQQWATKLGFTSDILGAGVGGLAYGLGA